ncbi:heparinase II/III domain-containing protein [Paludisphaera rhizosphaerae]|uniref:heparinase II/III domain-containing protein n=1 Tax=Paludisphaera rhizosphaerae TaxID=2711216 RepID=UPI0013EACFF6|nr:heparinase II/III family protein [Paludisphaera rhizosphaerae]
MRMLQPSMEFLTRLSRRWVPACLVAVAFVGTSHAEDVLKTLRPGHPRLILLDADVAKLRESVEKEPVTRELHKELKKQADKMLGEPPAVHRLIGPRLLDQSRLVLRRVTVLAALHRIDGDRKYADRAILEMKTAAGFPDWNPSHFLDTAEMSNALGLGYDWLYSVMTPDDRRVVREAIVEKGLKPGLKIYESKGWWSKSPNNWNQVCNGGLTVGALAIADEVPEAARQVVDAARKSIPIAMKSYAPDGGWEEGPGYWSYATAYNTYYLDALQTALGTDFGLGDSPGFAEAGEFRMHTIGPIGRTFNFADAGDRSGPAAEMLWLSGRFNRPSYAAHELALTAPARRGVFHLIWGLRASPGSTFSGEALDAAFRRINVACFRSAWGDPNALYVGFKGGDNKAGHSHLDLGSFVLDAQGERWAVDLGSDDYNLPGYFGKNRWDYYRLRTESHNTLLIDDANQDPKAEAPLVRFLSTPERGHAVADLTAAYAPTVSKAWRGVARLGSEGVLIQDEIEAARPVKLKWNFHTDASKIQTEGGQATLSKGDRKLTLRVVEPAGATFAVEPCDPPKPQKQQPNVHNVCLTFKDVTKTRIVVVAELPHNGVGQPSVEPLKSWADASRK